MTGKRNRAYRLPGMSPGMSLSIPLRRGYGERIAGQSQKRYTDKNAAMKYLEGRKKAYSHLFTEISPPVPEQYKDHFTVHGALLPGYTEEGQEPEKTVTAPGRDSGKAGRASVLEKLSDAKRQEKAAPLKAPDKKKEDIHR